FEQSLEYLRQPGPADAEVAGERRPALKLTGVQQRLVIPGQLERIAAFLRDWFWFECGVGKGIPGKDGGASERSLRDLRRGTGRAVVPLRENSIGPPNGLVALLYPHPATLRQDWAYTPPFAGAYRLRVASPACAPAHPAGNRRSALV